tara:strand:- start:4414 stop:4635 length:222 start_codon:yes stop_codon:yes gene_type:complete
MDQLRSYKASGTDRESGNTRTLDFDESDAADAITVSVRTFGAGEFLLLCEDGRSWRIHVAEDHSWWLESVSRL